MINIEYSTQERMAKVVEMIAESILTLIRPTDPRLSELMKEWEATTSIVIGIRGNATCDKKEI